MCTLNSRAPRVVLAVLLTVFASCTDEPSPSEPMRGLEPQFNVGDVLMVTNTSGGTDIGSLRWAMNFVTGGEVIQFASNLAGQTITLDSTVMIDASVTIEGPAAEGITISGGGRVIVVDFSLSSDEEAVLRNVTIANGMSTSNGAGIIVRGSGSLRLENSTVTGNVAAAWPAIVGISTTLVNTTVSGNTATILTSPAILSNHLELVNSTIAYNASPGIGFSSLVLRNSVISNHSAPNCVSSIIGTTYEGNNIADDDTCGGPFDMLVASPQLGALADNGGPTMTHAIAAGSPAINAGADCTTAVDQRYVPRDGQCDLGAYEFIEFTTVDLTVASSATFDKDGWAVLTGTVRCSRNETFDLHVLLEQIQKSGRGTIDVHAAATTPIACSTNVLPWSVALVTTDDPFQNGNALATVGTLNTEKWVTPASKSQAVKLFKGRK